MKIKRIFLIFTILIIILSNSLVFADLEDNEEINVNEVIETSKNVESTPNINSQVALIYDRTGKKILFEKNGKKQFKMASTTKIMTATVVLENAKLDDVVTIENKAAWTGGSRLGLKKDDKIEYVVPDEEYEVNNNITEQIIYYTGNDGKQLASWAGTSMGLDILQEKNKNYQLIWAAGPSQYDDMKNV